MKTHPFQNLSLPVMLQLTEHIPLAIAVFDDHMHYLYANSYWMRAYDIEGQNIIGKSHYEVFPEIDDRWKSIHQRCLRGEVMKAEADPFPRLDGHVDYVTWEVGPWYTQSGEVGGLIMITNVVNDQIQTQRNFDDILSTLNIALVEIDPYQQRLRSARGRLLEQLSGIVPTAMENSIEAAAEELLLRGFSTAESMQVGLMALRKGLQEDIWETVEIDLLGHRIRLLYIPHYDESGKILTVTNILADVTDEYLARRALEESQQIAATLYDLTRRVSAAKDYQEVTKVVHRVFVGEQRVSAVLLLIREDGREKELELVGIHDSAGQGVVELGWRSRMATYPSVELWRNAEYSVMVKDIATDPNMDEASRKFNMAFGVKSMVLVPIRHAGKGIGVLAINWFDAIHEFSPVELAILDALSGIISPQIAQLVTLEERTKLIEQLDTEQQIIRALYDLSRRVAQANTYADIAALLLLTFSSDQRYSVTLSICRQEDPLTLEVVGAFDSQIGVVEKWVGSTYTIEDPASVAWWWQATQPLIIEDVATDTIMNTATRELILSNGIKSQLYVTLRQNQRVLGLITMNWFEHSYEFSTIERAMIEALANVISPQVAQLLALEEQRRINQMLSERDTALGYALSERDQLIEQLEESVRFKDQFLANMSHELRTPLNAILGYAGLVLDDESLTDDLAYMVRRISDNSKRLLSLINDILDISRINADRVKIVERPLDIRAVVKGWYSDFKQVAERRNLAFHTEIDPKMPKLILADDERLGQIVNNLLDNAFKYTEGGGVILRVKHEGDFWRVEVADTGPGIPETWKHLIFDEFRQIDSSTRRKYGGAGLGLAIVKKLALLMGGNVSVDSEVGRGSTFAVTLPLKVAPTPENES